MRTLTRVLIVAATLGMPSVALAELNDFNGYAEIQRGDLAAAERILVDQRRMFAGDPDLDLNLAMVYMQTGRTADARALYQLVLNRPDEAMDMAKGPAASSHDLARTGLARLDRMQLASQ